MSAAGQARSTVQARSAQNEKGDEFLDYISKNSATLSVRWGKAWADVPHKELSQQEIWAHVATFLTTVYEIKLGNKNAGKHLDLKSAHQTFTGMIHQARSATGDAAPEIKVSGRHASCLCVRRAPPARACTAIAHESLSHSLSLSAHSHAEILR